MSYVSVRWVHPSWRDLVIEEIGRNAVDRRGFLNRCGVEGIELALSFGGGATGTRTLPLLIDQGDWQTLQERIVALLRTTGAAESLAILRTLRNVSKAGPASMTTRRDQWAVFTRTVLDACRRLWSENRSPIGWQHVAAYYELSLQVHPLPPGPELDEVWDRCTAAVEQACRESSVEPSTAEAAVSSLLHLINTISENEPRFLRSIGFPATRIERLHPLTEYGHDVADTLMDDPMAFDADEVESAEALAGRLGELAVLVPDAAPSLGDIRDAIYRGLDPAREAHDQANAEEKEAPSTGSGFDPDPEDGDGDDGQSFDVTRFFADL